MTVLVACETLLLVLLLVLVASLLRSHAEILRRLGPPDEDTGDEELAASLASPRVSSRCAVCFLSYYHW